MTHHHRIKAFIGKGLCEQLPMTHIQPFASGMADSTLVKIQARHMPALLLHQLQRSAAATTDFQQAATRFCMKVENAGFQTVSPDRMQIGS